MLRGLLSAWATGDIRLRDLQILRSFRKNKETARQWGECAQLEARVVQLTAAEHHCSEDEVLKVVDRWIKSEPVTILTTLADPRLRQSLTRLRLRGYRLGVLSDYPGKSKLEAMGLPLRLFDAVVETEAPEVSALKPHPRGFWEVCRRLGMQPEAVLYFGDRRQVDGEGARAAHMPFVLCKTILPVTRQPPVLKYLYRLEHQLTGSRGGGYSREGFGCWLCGGASTDEFAPSRIPQDLGPDLVKITDARYGMTARLLRCGDCGFIYADLDSARSLESLYQHLVDDEYQESSIARRKSFATLLKQIRILRPTAVSLLDIGASIGAFCAEAEQTGFRVEGIEPSAWAVAEGRRRYGVTLHEGYFPHPAVEVKKFDVVTLCDVIEHVSRPMELLQAAHRCLTPGGLLVLVTPDISSLAARVMGHRWWHFRSAHIGYFSRQTMLAALESAGFQVEKIVPYTWWFPLGYVMKRLESYLPLGLVNRLMGANRLWAVILKGSVPVNLRDSYVYFAKTSEK